MGRSARTLHVPGCTARTLAGSVLGDGSTIHDRPGGAVRREHLVRRDFHLPSPKSSASSPGSTSRAEAAAGYRTPPHSVPVRGSRSDGARSPASAGRTPSPLGTAICRGNPSSGMAARRVWENPQTIIRTIPMSRVFTGITGWPPSDRQRDCLLIVVASVVVTLLFGRFRTRRSSTTGCTRGR